MDLTKEVCACHLYMTVEECWGHFLGEEQERKYWNTWAKEFHQPLQRFNTKMFLMGIPEKTKLKMRSEYLSVRLQDLKDRLVVLFAQHKETEDDFIRDILMDKIKETNYFIKKIVNEQQARAMGGDKKLFDKLDIQRANDMDIASTFDIPGLKKQGSKRHSAPCLWHTEKTGSMVLYEGGKGFHCFGCGKSGKAIDFAMKLMDLSFPEALKYLLGK